MKLLNILLCLLLSSCGMFMRREYEDVMMENTGPFNMGDMFVPKEDFQVVAGDVNSGDRSYDDIMARTPLNRYDRENAQFQRSLAKELTVLENQMSDREYDKYMQIRNDLGGVSNRIYYLNLRPWERQAYLRSRNIDAAEPVRHRAPIGYGYSNNAINRAPAASSQYAAVPRIQVGMDKGSVLGIMGDPMTREFSGDPRFENEKWPYSAPGGRVLNVFFSSGRVIGWSY